MRVGCARIYGKLGLVLLGAGLWGLLYQTALAAPTAPSEAVPEKSEIEQLRQMVVQEQRVIADCKKRIDALEAAQRHSGPVPPKSTANGVSAPPSPKVQSVSAPKSSSAASWTNRVKLNGDFRFQFEYIHQNIHNPFAGGTAITNELFPPKQINTRERQRIRLRLAGAFTVNPEITIGARLSTSLRYANGGDPVSPNQVLGSGFSRKDIWLDLAYFDYHPLAFERLHVYGGKIPNPYYAPGGGYKTQLIWDSDLNPEGLALTYATSQKLQPWELSGAIGYYQVEERALDYDSELLGLQGIAKYNFLDNGRGNVRAGVSYYDYIHAKHYPFFFLPTNSWSNSMDVAVLDGLGLYAQGYHLLEGFTEVNFPLGSLPGVVFADYVQNLEPLNHAYDLSRGNVGWAIGAGIGKCAAPGTWGLHYEYRSTQRDAVVGQFNDSDFGGGGTNSHGHVVMAEYAPVKNVRLALTYIMAHNNGSEYLKLIPVYGGSEKYPGPYRRLQLDFNFTF